MGQRAILSWISRHSYHSAEQTVKNKKLDHRVPTTPRRTHAKAQPPPGTVLVRVLKPLAGLALPPSQFKEHDGQHQIGAMRRLAAAGIGAVECGSIESGHGLSDLPRQMLGRQLGIDLAPGG
jgi:hypothetical protein